MDTRLSATERVVGLDLDGAIMAYPFTAVAEVEAVNDEVGGQEIIVLHKEGAASALDSGTISEGRDVGSVAVFNRTFG